MRAPQSVIIQRDQVTAVAIEERYYLVRQSDKVAALTRILEHEDSKRGLIFARTRVGTAELATALTRHGFGADILNGDLTQEARERVLNRFRNNQIQVLVATDVAARGLDIDDISHVFNYDLPSEVEVYVHRIGRTSKTGIAISLITPASSRHSFSRASSKPALRNRGDKDSHETGMVRLTLDVGKTHGIGPSDLVGTIAYHADIPGNAIGKIRIENQKSFVDPECSCLR